MNLKPDFIFESSWEVCNKVGGIYTVLATRANTMQKYLTDQILFIGPDLGKHSNQTFIEDDSLLADWQRQAKADGLKLRIGRWNVPGKPMAVLVDFQIYFASKNEIFLHLWEDYGVDSLHAYGDYDESSMFAFAAAKVVESFYNFSLRAKKVVFHANEWMLGLALLYIRKYVPQIGTVFTTHATTVGRSIAGNGKHLYEYLPGYNGNQMAYELNVASKHSIERAAAQNADSFTTVSAITARECAQLLERTPDQLLLNGFENDFVPQPQLFETKRWAARHRLLDVVGKLTGCTMPEDTLIVSTSGRYEFRNKGLDVFVDAIARLRNNPELKKHIVAFINVPAWVAESRTDLAQRMATNKAYADGLACPYISHWLYNMEGDQMLNAFKNNGFHNLPDDKIKIIFVPCYLDGHDGIFDMHYYDIVIGNDLCVYPSYYEPWGYTPLEAIAFGVPCITTDLAGFGLWAKEELHAKAEIKNGVEVIHRNDSNYNEVADTIANVICKYSNMTAFEIKYARNKATELSQKALWKHFFKAYEKAYNMALKKAQERTNN